MLACPSADYLRPSLSACLSACLSVCLSACLFFSAWSTACTGDAAVFGGYKPLYHACMHACMPRRGESGTTCE